MTMAIGDVTPIGNGEAKMIELLATLTAANGKPSGASAGLAINSIYSLFGRLPKKAVLKLSSSAGSGTMTATFRLWGYTSVDDWSPCGPGADATKGVINLETAIGESDTDKLRHTEVLDDIFHFERLYLELVSIGGTSTAVGARLLVQRPGGE
jgi:hypothetical protein